jgi:hypothetical protein
MPGFLDRRFFGPPLGQLMAMFYVSDGNGRVQASLKSDRNPRGMTAESRHAAINVCRHGD